jgi:L-cystine uptake protein TcyP (sodium:dicarboxylate symporter family)
MVAEEIITMIPQEFASKISLLTKTLQALGGIILLYIIFGIVNLLINKKKKEDIKKIRKDIEEIKEYIKKKKKKKKN